LITQYEVLDEIRSTNSTWVASLERHKQTFATSQIVRIGRGFFSEKNVTSCKKQRRQKSCVFHSGAAAKRPSAKPMREPGVSRTATLSPAPRAHLGVFPGSRHEELSRRRSRAFELWVAAAVLANNLMKIAALLRTDHRADESA